MSRFIELYDDTGYKYIVDIDKITSVCVEGKRIWFDRKTTLDICDKSKEGRKVSLSTATLFADSGMECTVKRYEYLLGAGVWRASCDEGVVRVDEMHLIRPDTFGALMNDIEAAMNCPASEEPTHAYNVVSGMCDACADRCGGTLCQARALHSICYRIHSLLAGDGE